MKPPDCKSGALKSHRRFKSYPQHHFLGEDNEMVAQEIPTVYVVVSDRYEMCLHGAFSSLELAREYANARCEMGEKDLIIFQLPLNQGLPANLADYKSWSTLSYVEIDTSRR